MNRDQLEEHMGTILMQIAERQRQIRAAREAEKDLERLRAELTDLAHQYLDETPPGIARIVGRR